MNGVKKGAIFLALVKIWQKHGMLLIVNTWRRNYGY